MPRSDLANETWHERPLDSANTTEPSGAVLRIYRGYACGLARAGTRDAEHRR
jgi:hypothetical protein